MLEWLKNLFKSRPKNGKHFTRDEKEQILHLIRCYEEEVYWCQSHNCKCSGFCFYLNLFGRYEYLCALYHNRAFYSGKTRLTVKNRYFWDRKDYNSRLKAIELLREAIIKD